MLASPPSMSLVGIRYTGSQLTPWLLLSLWPLLLLATTVAKLSACMVALAAADTAAAAAAAAAAVSVHCHR